MKSTIKALVSSGMNWIYPIWRVTLRRLSNRITRGVRLYGLLCLGLDLLHSLLLPLLLHLLLLHLLLSLLPLLHTRSLLLLLLHALPLLHGLHARARVCVCGGVDKSLPNRTKTHIQCEQPRAVRGQEQGGQRGEE